MIIGRRAKEEHIAKTISRKQKKLTLRQSITTFLLDHILSIQQNRYFNRIDDKHEQDTLSLTLGAQTQLITSIWAIEIVYILRSHITVLIKQMEQQTSRQ